MTIYTIESSGMIGRVVRVVQVVIVFNKPHIHSRYSGTTTPSTPSTGAPGPIRSGYIDVQQKREKTLGIFEHNYSNCSNY